MSQDECFNTTAAPASSGSFATFAAIRRASSLVVRLAADRRPYFVRLWPMRHALQQSQLVRRKTLCRQANTCTLAGRGAPGVGKSMFRSTQFRFAVIALFAVAAVSLTAVSARALSQESNGAGESGNSTFADPDEQVNIFGYGQGAQQFEPSGSGQLGIQRGQLTPFKHFQSNGLGSPPDPLSRPSN